MGSMHTNAPMLSTTAAAPVSTKERKISRRICACSPRPNEMDTATPLPIESPSKIDVKNVISV